MNKKQILVVEDDVMIANLISTTLEMSNYGYLKAGNGAEAIMEALTHKPDVMVLDLGLPDMDGMEIIRKVRTWSSMPIIVISARSEDSDKVEALDAGADDYLTKPFSVEEFLARIRVALRRINSTGGGKGTESSVYENGELSIDFAAGCVTMGGAELHLTPMEYKLLCLLAKNTGKVLSYNYILKEVWGSFSDSDMASLRVFMTTLRKKLEKNSSKEASGYIQTHMGVGYRMINQH